LVERLVRNQ